MTEHQRYPDEGRDGVDDAGGLHQIPSLPVIGKVQDVSRHHNGDADSQHGAVGEDLLAGIDMPGRRVLALAEKTTALAEPVPIAFLRQVVARPENENQQDAQ